MKIIQKTVTENPCYKAGRKIQVKGLMLHSVGCPQPSAEVFVRQYNSSNAKACVHAFVDANTGDVYQTLPWEHRAWHCGGDANNTHIGVEMCEPPCIRYTGGAEITCSDETRAREMFLNTLHKTAELFAYLCKQFGLDPLKDGVIISHKEGHDRKLASGHSDPDHLFRQLHMDYSMDTFRNEVAALMKKGKGNKKSAKAHQQKNGAQAASRAIQPGDIVTIAKGSVYYGGKAIPDWVVQDTWIVKSISGDRAVLGANLSGSHDINSPVNTAFLTLTDKSMGGQSAAAPKVEKVTQTAGQGSMKVSDKGVALVAKYEGCRLDAYKCPAGVWTIGYGHTAGVKPGDKLPSKEEAMRLLKVDLEKYADSVNNCVKRGLITFTLNQNQFDALTSFCYNCGPGSLQKLVTGRDAATVANKLLEYNKGGGKVLAGLTKRREEERALFLS